MIEGFIFDLDDTLYCEHDFVRSGFQAVARALLQWENGRKVGQKALYEALIEEWEVNGRGRIFNAICERFAIPVDDIFSLVKVYREHQPSSIALYPDAEVLLGYLEKRQKKLGIITDGDQYVQWRKIRALGLDSRIPCIVVSDELGKECWKPSDKPYHKALECMGLRPEQCVYIGDNPHKDFCTARLLGMKTVRIIREVGDHMQTKLTPEYEADRIVHSLEELIETEHID